MARARWADMFDEDAEGVLGPWQLQPPNVSQRRPSKRWADISDASNDEDLGPWSHDPVPPSPPNPALRRPQEATQLVCRTEERGSTDAEGGFAQPGPLQQEKNDKDLQEQKSSGAKKRQRCPKRFPDQALVFMDVDLQVEAGQGSSKYVGCTYIDIITVQNRFTMIHVTLRVCKINIHTTCQVTRLVGGAGIKSCSGVFGVLAGAQVEAFATALLKQRDMWKLDVLDSWQRSLKQRTQNMRFSRQLWYDVVHRTNLRAGQTAFKLALAEFVKRQARRDRKA